MHSGHIRLEEFASLIKRRNAVEAAIAAHIGRPGHPGHVGEFIAALVFDIDLEKSATAKGFDGRFRSGPLAGRTVNVKMYPRNQGLLDINPDAIPDSYLVLGGRWAGAASSRGTSAPWEIANVFLFEAEELVDRLRQRRVKVGVATSVIRPLWDAAEVFPSSGNGLLRLTDDQRRLLQLFAPD